MGCCLKLESLESEAGMGSPMQVLTGRPCKGVREARQDMGEAKQGYGLNCMQTFAQSHRKFWDRIAAQNCPILRPRNRFLYSCVSVMLQTTHRSRGQFLSGAALVAKRSLSHQHTQQLNKKITG